MWRILVNGQTIGGYVSTETLNRWLKNQIMPAIRTIEFYYLGEM